MYRSSPLDSVNNIDPKQPEQVAKVERRQTKVKNPSHNSFIA